MIQNVENVRTLQKLMIKIFQKTNISYPTLAYPQQEVRNFGFLETLHRY